MIASIHITSISRIGNHLNHINCKKCKSSLIDVLDLSIEDPIDDIHTCIFKCPVCSKYNTYWFSYPYEIFSSPIKKAILTIL